MPIRLSESQSQLVGALVAALFGLGLLIVGRRLIFYDHVLAEPVTVLAAVVDAGQTRSSGGGSVNFVRYRFVDSHGKTRTGTSSGYSGTTGEAILVEYASRYPFVHRVAGEGKTSGYAWRWPIAGLGLFFLVAGVHWGWSIWALASAPNKPAR